MELSLPRLTWPARAYRARLYLSLVALDGSTSAVPTRTALGTNDFNEYYNYDVIGNFTSKANKAYATVQVLPVAQVHARSSTRPQLLTA